MVKTIGAVGEITQCDHLNKIIELSHFLIEKQMRSSQVV